MRQQKRLENYKCEGQLSFDDINWGKGSSVTGEASLADRVSKQEEPELEL